MTTYGASVAPTVNPIRICEHCNTPYAWQKSSAVLKMLHCGIFCEIAALGFSLEAISK